MKYLRRGSGYYIDVGAADLVANGDVKLVKGQIDHLTADAVVLADGTELPADVVVMATGYGSMNGWVADLIDQETADRLGKVWGLGSETTKDPGPWEGEQRNMWKPTQIENLWMHGGNLHQSRHYSLYLALQLKARFEGIDTPVYALQEVHHTVTSVDRECLSRGERRRLRRTEEDQGQDGGDDRADSGAVEHGVLLGDPGHAQQVGELLAPALAVAHLARRRDRRPARRSSAAGRSWSAPRCPPACRPSATPRRRRWPRRARRHR